MKSLEYPRIFQNNFSQEKFHLYMCIKRQENHHHFCSPEKFKFFKASHVVVFKCLFTELFLVDNAVLPISYFR